jgi:glycyl-tRNA synthetase alpha subunit
MALMSRIRNLNGCCNTMHWRSQELCLLLAAGLTWSPWLDAMKFGQHTQLEQMLALAVSVDNSSVLSWDLY